VVFAVLVDLALRVMDLGTTQERDGEEQEQAAHVRAHLTARR
jgi:hypothetical protein